MSRHWRDAAERWNARMQEHALAGHPARIYGGTQYLPGTKDFCALCEDFRAIFSRAVAHLAQRPKRLKEAERA